MAEHRSDERGKRLLAIVGPSPQQIAPPHSSPCLISIPAPPRLRCFCLCSYEQAWEDPSFEYPPNLAPPTQILIDASNGASDYGNKFGEPLVAGYTRTYGQRLPDGERREWIKPIMFRCAALRCAALCLLGAPCMRVGGLWHWMGRARWAVSRGRGAAALLLLLCVACLHPGRCTQSIGPPTTVLSHPPAPVLPNTYCAAAAWARLTTATCTRTTPRLGCWW